MCCSPNGGEISVTAHPSYTNIVVADNVGGNLTLRLTNVPWDQALDIVMDARNLDMRKNGNVLWIAPTAEIAAREQQLLQAQLDRRILEPLQTVIIPVNYASAEDLNRVREEAMKASQILGQKIYEASAAEAAATADEGEAAGDDVVEAEIVDEGEES